MSDCLKADSVRRHRLGGNAIVLIGGPYELHIFVGEKTEPDITFPAEPALDLNGKPSCCAPRPVVDGPVRYVNTGKVNIMGMTCFRFERS